MAGVLVVGDAVEDVRIDQDARIRVEACQVDPSDDLPGRRRDDGDEVRLP